MAYVFSPVTTVTIVAKQVGDNDISMPGMTSDSTSPEAYAQEMNKMLAIVGREVVVSGMIRKLSEEAVEE